MRTSVALAQGDGDLGHGGFAVCEEQFGSVVDDGVVFLSGTGQESGYVNQCDDGDVEAVAEAYEAGSLAAGVAVEYSCEGFGLVGHDADGLSVEAGEAYDDVLGKVFVDFKEFAVVYDGMNDVVHVVGVVGVVGQNFVERVFHAVDGVVALYAGCFFQIVLRQIGEEGTDFLCQLFFTADSEVGYTALGAVYGGTA